MKRKMILLLTILSVFFLFISLSFENTSFAQQGCCKIRQSRSGSWYRINAGFDECRNLNQNKDGDDLYQPLGRVWWDQHCS
jgi:hypothetical protein